MPLLPSDYTPPWLLRSGHLQTLYPALVRKVEGVAYGRERIDTPDGDFLNLDWLKVGAQRVVIVSHGLEGHTGRSYIRGMARTLAGEGWDVLAWNYRGCGGEINRLVRTYHSGVSDDLDVVVQHAFVQGYTQVAFVGFSLGGNITLKYLGERSNQVDDRLQAAITFSVPCDLDAGSAHIDRTHNWAYRERFLRGLRDKIRQKHALFPDVVDIAGLDHVATLRAFDDTYTAPLNGFDDAADYYARCSCLPLLPHIQIPTLLVNAADDPFLPEACYPIDLARAHPHLYFEMPHYGGHVGFVAFNEAGTYWSEQRAAAFLSAFNVPGSTL